MLKEAEVVVLLWEVNGLAQARVKEEVVGEWIYHNARHVTVYSVV